MISLLHNVLKKLKGIYHQICTSYFYILYRDCLDVELKEKFYIKYKYHETLHSI